jgi:hypothetical protein
LHKETFALISSMTSMPEGQLIATAQHI